MKKWYLSSLLMSGLFLTACVTINVYFPAAEMNSAAEKIVRDVLQEEQKNNSDVNEPQTEAIIFTPKSNSFALNVLDFFIGSAQAQPQANITLSSPAIDVITSRMKERVSSHLRDYLNESVIGFTNDGLVEIVNIDNLALKDRQAVKKIVADENRDRIALYREMAIANDHPEWEDQVRLAFVKQWIAQAQSGWLYQDNAGRWVNK